MQTSYLDGSQHEVASLFRATVLRKARAAAELDPDLRIRRVRQERLLVPDRLPDRVLVRRGPPAGRALQEELPPHGILLGVPACLQM